MFLLPASSPSQTSINLVHWWAFSGNKNFFAVGFPFSDRYRPVPRLLPVWRISTYHRRRVGKCFNVISSGDTYVTPGLSHIRLTFTNMFRAAEESQLRYQATMTSYGSTLGTALCKLGWTTVACLWSGNCATSFVRVLRNDILQRGGPRTFRTWVKESVTWGLECE
jgi:hypothetical protein